jgi:hypothetical protein
MLQILISDPLKGKRGYVSEIYEELGFKPGAVAWLFSSFNEFGSIGIQADVKLDEITVIKTKDNNMRQDGIAVMACVLNFLFDKGLYVVTAKDEKSRALIERLTRPYESGAITLEPSQAFTRDSYTAQYLFSLRQNGLTC